jgi:hypothetical protein
MPLARSAAVKARVVLRASWTRHALSKAAFSRSSSPIRPRRCESVTATSGHSSWRMDAACSSHAALRGENTAATATDRMPAARMRRAAARMPAASNGTSGRPSNSWPPSSITTSPRTSAARSSGQSTKGGSDAPEGRPTRTAATRSRSRRCTTALVKWVVPIIAACASRAAGARSTSPASAREMPVVTSSVVGVFTAATTASSSSSTASVLVPPTSMPMRRLMRTPSGSRGRIRRPGGPRARSPSA